MHFQSMGMAGSFFGSIISSLTKRCYAFQYSRQPECVTDTKPAFVMTRLRWGERECEVEWRASERYSPNRFYVSRDSENAERRADRRGAARLCATSVTHLRRSPPPIWLDSSRPQELEDMPKGLISDTNFARRRHCSPGR